MNARESPRRHPQFAARGFFEDLEQPVVGRHPIARPPFRFATVDRWNRTAAPTMGQYNREVLRELGLADADIAHLEAEKVIGYELKDA